MPQRVIQDGFSANQLDQMITLMRQCGAERPQEAESLHLEYNRETKKFSVVAGYADNVNEQGRIEENLRVRAALLEGLGESGVVSGDMRSAKSTHLAQFLIGSKVAAKPLNLRAVTALDSELCLLRHRQGANVIDRVGGDVLAAVLDEVIDTTDQAARELLLVRAQSRIGGYAFGELATELRHAYLGSMSKVLLRIGKGEKIVGQEALLTAVLDQARVDNGAFFELADAVCLRFSGTATDAEALANRPDGVVESETARWLNRRLDELMARVPADVGAERKTAFREAMRVKFIDLVITEARVRLRGKPTGRTSAERAEFLNRALGQAETRAMQRLEMYVNIAPKLDALVWQRLPGLFSDPGSVHPVLKPSDGFDGAGLMIDDYQQMRLMFVERLIAKGVSRFTDEVFDFGKCVDNQTLAGAMEQLTEGIESLEQAWETASSHLADVRGRALEKVDGKFGEVLDGIIAHYSNRLHQQLNALVGSGRHDDIPKEAGLVADAIIAEVNDVMATFDDISSQLDKALAALTEINDKAEVRVKPELFRSVVENLQERTHELLAGKLPYDSASVKKQFAALVEQAKRDVADPSLDARQEVKQKLRDLFNASPLAKLSAAAKVDLRPLEDELEKIVIRLYKAGVCDQTAELAFAELKTRCPNLKYLDSLMTSAEFEKQLRQQPGSVFGEEAPFHSDIQLAVKLYPVELGKEVNRIFQGDFAGWALAEKDSDPAGLAVENLKRFFATRIGVRQQEIGERKGLPPEDRQTLDFIFKYEGEGSYLALNRKSDFDLRLTLKEIAACRKLLGDRGVVLLRMAQRLAGLKTLKPGMKGVEEALRWAFDGMVDGRYHDVMANRAGEDAIRRLYEYKDEFLAQSAKVLQGEQGRPLTDTLLGFSAKVFVVLAQTMLKDPAFDRLEATVKELAKKIAAGVENVNQTELAEFAQLVEANEGFFVAGGDPMQKPGKGVVRSEYSAAAFTQLSQEDELKAVKGLDKRFKGMLEQTRKDAYGKVIADADPRFEFLMRVDEGAGRFGITEALTTFQGQYHIRRFTPEVVRKLSPAELEGFRNLFLQRSHIAGDSCKKFREQVESGAIAVERLTGGRLALTLQLLMDFGKIKQGHPVASPCGLLTYDALQILKLMDESGMGDLADRIFSEHPDLLDAQARIATLAKGVSALYLANHRQIDDLRGLCLRLVGHDDVYRLGEEIQTVLADYEEAEQIINDHQSAESSLKRLEDQFKELEGKAEDVKSKNGFTRKELLALQKDRSRELKGLSAKLPTAKSDLERLRKRKSELLLSLDDIEQGKSIDPLDRYLQAKDGDMAFVGAMIRTLSMKRPLSEIAGEKDGRLYQGALELSRWLEAAARRPGERPESKAVRFGAVTAKFSVADDGSVQVVLDGKTELSFVGAKSVLAYAAYWREDFLSHPGLYGIDAVGKYLADNRSDREAIVMVLSGMSGLSAANFATLSTAELYGLFETTLKETKAASGWGGHIAAAIARQKLPSDENYDQDTLELMRKAATDKELLAAGDRVVLPPPEAVKLDGPTVARQRFVRDLLSFRGDVAGAPLKPEERLKAALVNHAETVASLISTYAKSESLRQAFRVGGVSGGMENLVVALIDAVRRQLGAGEVSAASVTAAVAKLDFAGLAATFEQQLTAAMKGLQQLFTSVFGEALRDLKPDKGIVKNLEDLAGSHNLDLEFGYGKFLLTVVENYFARLPDVDRRSVMAAALSTAAAGGDRDAVLQAMVGAAGPVFQKFLQGLPTVHLPPLVANIVSRIKSSAASVDRDYLRAQLARAIVESRGGVERIEVVKSLGAATVGEALLCKVYARGDRQGRECVIKVLRPEARLKCLRDGELMRKLIAENDIRGMGLTFENRFREIEEEFDFTCERRNVRQGGIYAAADYDNRPGLPKDPDVKVRTIEIDQVLPLNSSLLALTLAPGETYSRMVDDADAVIRQDLVECLGADRARKYEHHQGRPVLSTFREYFLAKQRMADRYHQLDRRYRALTRLFEVWLYQAVLGDGTFHGDLHAGNMLSQDDFLTVIDFGNVGKLTDAERTLILACALKSPGVFKSNLEAVLKVQDPKLDFAKLWKGGLGKKIEQIIGMGSVSNLPTRLRAVLDAVSATGTALPGSLFGFAQSLVRMTDAMESLAAAMAKTRAIFDDIELKPRYDEKGYNVQDPFDVSRKMSGCWWFELRDGTAATEDVRVDNDICPHYKAKIEEAYQKLLAEAQQRGLNGPEVPKYVVSGLMELLRPMEAFNHEKYNSIGTVLEGMLSNPEQYLFNDYWRDNRFALIAQFIGSAHIESLSALRDMGERLRVKSSAEVPDFKASGTRDDEMFAGYVDRAEQKAIKDPEYFGNLLGGLFTWENLGLLLGHVGTMDAASLLLSAKSLGSEEARNSKARQSVSGFKEKALTGGSVFSGLDIDNLYKLYEKLLPLPLDTLEGETFGNWASDGDCRRQFIDNLKVNLIRYRKEEKLLGFATMGRHCRQLALQFVFGCYAESQNVFEAFRTKQGFFDCRYMADEDFAALKSEVDSLAKGWPEEEQQLVGQIKELLEYFRDHKTLAKRTEAAARIEVGQDDVNDNVIRIAV